MDSVCYAAILGQEYNIHMITFAYGQRARREISCARRFSRILGAVDHRVVDIGFMKSLYGNNNALTDPRKALPSGFERSLVVPIRNAVFITIASAWAFSIGAELVAYGAHMGDVPTYSDCRPEFTRSLSRALNLADADNITQRVRREIRIKSPAIDGMDKAALIRAGERLLGDSIFRTWSCYSDGIKIRKVHVHCGRCESCINRKVALLDAGIEDKTRYADSAGRKDGASKRDIHQH